MHFELLPIPKAGLETVPLSLPFHPIDRFENLHQSFYRSSNMCLHIVSCLQWKGMISYASVYMLPQSIVCSYADPDTAFVLSDFNITNNIDNFSDSLG